MIIYVALPSIVISSFRNNEEYTRPVIRKRHIHEYVPPPMRVTIDGELDFLLRYKLPNVLNIHKKMIEPKIITDAAANLYELDFELIVPIYYTNFIY